MVKNLVTMKGDETSRDETICTSKPGQLLSLKFRKFNEW